MSLNFKGEYSGGGICTDCQVKYIKIGNKTIPDTKIQLLFNKKYDRYVDLIVVSFTNIKKISKFRPADCFNDGPLSVTQARPTLKPYWANILYYPEIT